MTDPYAHYTPKPLEEQVPGAWNFVEPNPNALRAEQPVTIMQPMQMGIKLTPEAREVLQERCPTLFSDQPILEREWRDLEDALTEVLFGAFTPRYIMGYPKDLQSTGSLTDPPGRPGHAQLVAGGH